ncbi:right-handed parallel beta-helix repeat-containing protein [Polaribacter sargassicola]|uniref:right-handed parallel beta-helix repeat-containing protein n=1 Tax=Polaribacter sargassicola TaxID=2836891 RepID=UPI001F1D44B8|nr:right-handed parallel beta-helix repeat-containing protein [Polaribacter sp. DS7-9]MCG1037104.1 right-handed parallel beta-helix repeat-containing protein [Polaribacter sp. DS7-9]
MRNLYLILIFLICCLPLNAQTKFYVSPQGKNTNTGAKEQPFASLLNARNAIRNHKKTATKQQSYTVIVKDGTYLMDEPFELTAEDSGTEEYPIIYKAEKGAKPVFSGGKTIKGITVNTQGIWQVKIPESVYYKWQFDQLYVNGKRATLARTPNKGFLELEKVNQDIWKQGSGKVALKAEQELFFNKEIFKPLLSIEEEEIPQVRFKTYHKWDYTLRHIDGINKDSLSITTSGKGMKPWNPLKKGTRVVVENYKAALDTPGEWFLSKKGMLYYIPRKGETPENTTVVVPVLEQLMSIKGNASKNKYVEHIQFKGLHFEYCHYKIPASGSEPNQAAAKLNAAIEVEGAKNIIFSNGEISKTGQHALWFGKGVSNSAVENTYMYNLGGGGVYLGDFKALKGKEHAHHLTVHNNIIQSGGQEFPAAVGIWVGHSSDSNITHNNIGNFYYTGISVGWTWGYKPSLAKRNRIAYNHIHHIGWDLLSDMAAIYTLGASEGTVVENNLIHHIHSFSYGGWGMYADEGSTGIVFKNNLVYNTKTGGFQQNYGKANIATNNILAYAKKYQMQCTVAEKHKSFTFTNNIVLFNKGMVAKGAWDKIIADVDYNIYWNEKGDEYNFNKHNFKDWKKLGLDKHSFLINPEFKNPLKGNFKFKNQSSYKKINFKPFDYTKAGVLGNNEWKEKAKLSDLILENFDKTVNKNLELDPERG